ncbi:hypothetical protein D3C87_1336030 [compost metagenome]
MFDGFPQSHLLSLAGSGVGHLVRRHHVGVALQLVGDELQGDVVLLHFDLSLGQDRFEGNRRSTGRLDHHWFAGRSVSHSRVVLLSRSFRGFRSVVDRLLFSSVQTSYFHCALRRCCGLRKRCFELSGVLVGTGCQVLFTGRVRRAGFAASGSVGIARLIASASAIHLVLEVLINDLFLRGLLLLSSRFLILRHYEFP